MHSHDHETFVNAWLATAAAKDSSTEQLLQLFEEAFAAMWTRAHIILGDVTLAAILDRVVYSAAAQHTPLSALRVGSSGLQFGPFRDQARALPPAQIEAALRTTLVEFLSVLGNLTAEILAPALYDALSRVKPAPGSRAQNAEGEDET